MKMISYLQFIALASLLVAITMVWITALDMISTPIFERTYNEFNIKGIPFFFGICCFAFEGNTVTLEIYRKMENKRQDFTKALGLGLAIATALFMLTGILFYHAFAQYT